MEYSRQNPSKPDLKACPPTAGNGKLRAVVEKAAAKTKTSLAALTVLSTAVDPYRLDTDAGHRDGSWIAEQLNRLLARGRKIHWRGLHYLLVSSTSLTKPNGEPYRNIDSDWIWLVESAGKSARWLGYVGFDRITDARNAEPVIFRKAKVLPKSVISVGIEVVIPNADDLTPTPVAEGFVARQAYQFVIFGEKTSLEPILLPIARAKQADLYLPSGEISDTLLYRIAVDATKDGRPLIVFTVSDCDPAGFQMPISIARKLQAFKDLLFPKLEFAVVPVALLPEQVRELDLPSTPLKDGEKRADRWVQAFGIEQTEVDALMVLRPDTLREMVEAAFEPYFDATLERRVRAAEDEWMEKAEQAIADQINPELLASVREQAQTKLTELQAAIDDLTAQMELAAGDFVLPEIEIPAPEIDESLERHALVDLDDDWITATRALIERKKYGNGNGHA